MINTREDIVAKIQANKASLNFTRARISLAIKAHGKTRTLRLESSERYTKIELGRLAHELAEMDSGSPYYPEEVTA